MKEFIRRSDDALILWQYNPASEIFIPLDRVANVFKILTMVEIMDV